MNTRSLCCTASRSSSSADKLHHKKLYDYDYILICDLASHTIHTKPVKYAHKITWWSRNNPLQGSSSLCSTTTGTYSPFGASSQISNQTSTSTFAWMWAVQGDGKAPNLLDLTGREIGIEGGSILLGGWRILPSNLASLCRGCCW